MLQCAPRGKGVSTLSKGTKLTVGDPETAFMKGYFVIISMATRVKSRFEAKHNYFKSLAHKVKCFKNIAKTLAERHQHLMCYYASSNEKFSKDWNFGRIK